MREGVEDQACANVEQVAARAVETAREASDRLTAQMLIDRPERGGARSAYRAQTARRSAKKDSEAFARRVSLLIDSMNSAAIDVTKILSNEVDDKAWAPYLKGDRGVFTRRAVRLLGGRSRARSRAIMRAIPSSGTR